MSLHLADIVFIIFDAVLLILFDVDILHLNMLKGGIPGFQWVFSLVFTSVTHAQYEKIGIDLYVPLQQESIEEPEPSSHQVIVNSMTR